MAAWQRTLVSDDGEREQTSIRDLGAMVAALRAQGGQARGQRHLLVRMNGADMGRVWSLGGERLSIGRAQGNDIVVDDDGTSRQHAVLERHDDRYAIVDQGSSNGTFISGKPVERHVLADGDLVNVGPACTLRYTRTDADSEALLVALHRSNAFDHLTETYNADHFLDVFERELSYARRHGTTLSVLMLDVDFFRALNDDHGYEAGDAVLKELANRLRRATRREDILAQTAGGVFLMLLRGIDIDQARVLAERLRETVAADPVPLPEGGGEVPVTMSVSCASLACVRDATAEALLHLIQRRMQQAKRSGRNRVVFREPAMRKPMPSKPGD